MRRALIALALSATGLAHAAGVSVYTSLAAWQAAVSGPVLTQDFSGYAVNQGLDGVQLLPGVTLSSNAGGPVHAFNATDRYAVAFGQERLVGDTYYQGQYAQPFLAAALDIVGFESDPNQPTTGQDQGKLSFLFADGTTEDLLISGTLISTRIFIGVISDSAIVSFKWLEAHEASGGNEETGLDNLRVAMAANQLPLPGTLPLALLALGAVPMVRRHRR